MSIIKMRTVSPYLLVLAVAAGLCCSAFAATGDINGDGSVNFKDIDEMAKYWLANDCENPGWCSGADINQDGDVNLVDFALVGQDWGTVEQYGETQLASYEPDEDPPYLTLGIHCDAGVDIVAIPANSVGLTAPDGDYILKIDISGEDGKIEFSHTWGSLTFDVAGTEELRFDCYFPASATVPTIIGVWEHDFLPGNWSGNWSPPSATAMWNTAGIDMTAFNPTTGHNEIWALVFEGMPNPTNGVIYIDNLRLYGKNPDYVVTIPQGVIAAGHDSRIDIRWQPVDDSLTQGYNIYRSTSATGTFTKINSSLHTATVYSDFFGTNGQTYHYYVTASVAGIESEPSAVVSGTSYAMTDAQLLTSVQEATFRYFWDFAHPVSGMARERYADYDRNTVTTGGTGMGIMTICVGAQRGFVTRAQAAERTLKILTFLDEKAQRYHGIWSHWLNGTTGESIPPDDDGYIKSDLVETTFLIQGILTARQYFDNMSDATEADINDLATELWEGVEWDWHLDGGTHLWWGWSPEPGVGFTSSFTFIGYTETMLSYLLAIASPTHSIPATAYYDGWAIAGDYTNGTQPGGYGYTQWVGRNDIPLFWVHYSFLGFDPNWSDAYCNYFSNSKNIALIDRAYCNDNPGEFTGYSNLVWGLTSSYSPFGYDAWRPWGLDNGTIAPTAAISSMPYTPTESIATLKHFYHDYSGDLWGQFGFHDAFNLTESWFSDGYLAIDQGTIVPMLENYRTELCWDLFMDNPEIQPMLDAIEATSP